MILVPTDLSASFPLCITGFSYTNAAYPGLPRTDCSDWRAGRRGLYCTRITSPPHSATHSSSIWFGWQHEACRKCMRLGGRQRTEPEALTSRQRFSVADIAWSAMSFCRSDPPLASCKGAPPLQSPKLFELALCEEAAGMRNGSRSAASFKVLQTSLISHRTQKSGQPRASEPTVPRNPLIERHFRSWTEAERCFVLIAGNHQKSSYRTYDGTIMQRSAYGQGSTHGQQPGGDTYGSSVPTAYMYASPVPPRENKDPWLFDQDGRIFHSGAPWMGLDFPQRRRIAKQQDVDGAHRWEYNLHGNAARLHGSTLEHGLPRQSITYTEHSSEQACLSSTHKTAAPHTVSEDRDPGHGPPSDSDRRSDDPMWDLADDTDLEEDVQGISSSDAAHCHAVIGREPVRTSLSTNDENMGTALSSDLAGAA
ncbi:uncharacterized protein MKK02DRAFT_29286 [Dioszegia hungarica]|uniref:Uncharacterized protein n=1 Tax=Dioszegia hungarica TaxID=4972 RepID=A0AA38HHD4_9TREE|nr:uncharacterized protein MKK02DRAFT_29286 [Dioszegia hungarica]KAI9639174.1 hypothetical protein MKK02DRAFT_29286 [Dioszegia hungarica]